MDSYLKHVIEKGYPHTTATVEGIEGSVDIYFMPWEDEKRAPSFLGAFYPDGERVMGTWRHGRSGVVRHIEQIEMKWSAERNRWMLITSDNCQSGPMGKARWKYLTMIFKPGEYTKWITEHRKAMGTEQKPEPKAKRPGMSDEQLSQYTKLRYSVTHGDPETVRKARRAIRSLMAEVRNGEVK